MHYKVSVLCAIMLCVPILSLLLTTPKALLRQRSCTAGMSFAIIAGVCVMAELMSLVSVLKACYS